jgi:hypothetical protein
MEEGMFMIRLAGIIELAVPMSKFHHAVIILNRPSSVTYTANSNNRKYTFISDV